MQARDDGRGLDLVVVELEVEVEGVRGVGMRPDPRMRSNQWEVLV